MNHVSNNVHVHVCLLSQMSYTVMTRGTNLMQQLWFIIIN